MVNELRVNREDTRTTSCIQNKHEYLRAFATQHSTPSSVYC